MANMSPKGFLNKIGKAKSAEGFFQQYREFLLTGELHPLTTPLVIKVDSGELLPTPALEELGQIVMAHLHAVALASMEKTDKTSSRASDKNVLALIVNNKNEEMESKYFYLGQEAIRWVDRHLVEQPTDCIGKVIHEKVILKGKPMEDVITREDAYFRLFPKSKQPFMKRAPSSVSSLKSRMKVSQSRASFSHG